jgi:hypothetical protein
MKTNEEKDELNLITLAQEYADEDKSRGLLESLVKAAPPKKAK